MQRIWRLAVAFFSISLSFGSAEIGTSLQKLWGKEGRSRVIITFKETIKDRELSLIGSAEQIKSALIKTLSRSRTDLGEFLNLYSDGGQILEEIWISNALVADVSHRTLKKLALRDDIAQIILDESEYLFKPQPDGVLDESNSAWTYGLRSLGVDKVRQTYHLTGKGVRVGIIDTGIDPDHPDLSGKISLWKDFNGKSPVPVDPQGHGTHCAGTIVGGSASGTNIGVAPDAKLVVARIFNKSGLTKKSFILKAMNWMADPDGNPNTNDHPSVVSNSWGSPRRPKWLDRARWNAVKNWVHLKIIPVFAAGNSGSRPKTLGSPASYPQSFAVGAVDSNDIIARFSSRGPVIWGGKTYIKPDITAPGVSVYSARTGGGYKNLSGTSMATPHIAGLIALLLEANPRLIPSNVLDLLTSTTKDLGEEGKDPDYGSGRADIFQAVRKLKEGRLKRSESQLKRFQSIHNQ